MIPNALTLTMSLAALWRSFQPPSPDADVAAFTSLVKTFEARLSQAESEIAGFSSGFQGHTPAELVDLVMTAADDRTALQSRLDALASALARATPLLVPTHAAFDGYRDPYFTLEGSRIKSKTADIVIEDGPRPLFQRNPVSSLVTAVPNSLGGYSCLSDSHGRIVLVLPPISFNHVGLVIHDPTSSRVTEVSSWTAPTELVPGEAIPLAVSSEVGISHQKEDYATDLKVFSRSFASQRKPKGALSPAPPEYILYRAILCMGSCHVPYAYLRPTDDWNELPQSVSEYAPGELYLRTDCLVDYGFPGSLMISLSGSWPPNSVVEFPAIEVITERSDVQSTPLKVGEHVEPRDFALTVESPDPSWLVRYRDFGVLWSSSPKLLEYNNGVTVGEY